VRCPPTIDEHRRRLLESAMRRPPLPCCATNTAHRSSRSMFPLLFPVAYLEHLLKRKAIAPLSDVEYRTVFGSAYSGQAPSIDGKSIDTRAIQGAPNVPMILYEHRHRADRGGLHETDSSERSNGTDGPIARHDLSVGARRVISQPSAPRRQFRRMGRTGDHQLDGIKARRTNHDIAQSSMSAAPRRRPADQEHVVAQLARHPKAIEPRRTR
jgi:hypothetical protein